LTFLSPYGRGTKRFGSFHLDTKKPPEPWLRESQFTQAAKAARAASDRMKAAASVGKGKTNRKGQA